MANHKLTPQTYPFLEFREQYKLLSSQLIADPDSPDTSAQTNARLISDFFLSLADPLKIQKLECFEWIGSYLSKHRSKLDSEILGVQGEESGGIKWDVLFFLHRYYILSYPDFSDIPQPKDVEEMIKSVKERSESLPFENPPP